MKRPGISYLQRSLKDTRGQSMIVMAISLAGVMAVCGAGLESGHVYYAYRLLVSSTNAATLAGAQTMSTALLTATSSQIYNNDVDSAVQEYSSVTGGYNANSFLHSAQIVTTNLSCSTTLEGTPFNVACVTPPGGSTGYNAITVTQTAKVPLWFGGLLGMPMMTLAASSEAAIRGGQDIPYNLAIIMDTTASMQDSIKGDSDCTTSQISCAVSGFTTMLENMDPCATDTTCTASTPYVDGVALFVFPAISTKYSANDYKQDYCSTLGSSDSVPYNFTNVTPGSSQNLDMETTGTNAGSYELIPFNDIYKTSDGTRIWLFVGFGYGGRREAEAGARDFRRRAGREPIMRRSSTWPRRRWLRSRQHTRDRKT